uniref:Uncharacterized protein n=1 Tax=Arundo donax TaxID=35708 RepID=A0A0A9EII6_ARUDO
MSIITKPYYHIIISDGTICKDHSAYKTMLSKEP